LEKALEQKVKVAGLFVDTHLPFLATYFADLVENNTLVEIKCPAPAKVITPEGILSTKIKSCEIKNGDLYLKKKVIINLYQIQSQLHVTRKNFWYFCIWTPKYNAILIYFIYGNNTKKKKLPKKKKKKIMEPQFKKKFYGLPFS